MEIRPVTEAEQLAASWLTVPGLPSAARQAQKVLERLGVDPRGQIVAVEGTTVCAACLYVLTGGRGATVLMPVLSAGERVSSPEKVFRKMLRQAVRACRDAGAVLIQSLVDEAPEQPWGRRLIDAGFSFLARLEYLELEVKQTPKTALDTTWAVEPYRPETEEQFSRLIAETYQGSLDCPALDGLRSPADVVASHKASGVFTPDGWSLVRCNGVPAGLVLVNRRADRRGCELVYMGVTARFRGRGLGRWLVAKAIATSRQLGCRRLAVAVDAGNAPARKLYEQAGFTNVGKRYAYYVPPDSPPAR